MTTAWDELVTTALIGTERRAFDLDRLAAVVDANAVPAAGNEAAVLAGAAVLGAYRRAGRLPARRVHALPDPAPEDERPVCSETAAQLLQLVLDGAIQAITSTDELVGAWLAACNRTAKRPPPRLLVTLLEVGAARPALRPAVAVAVGPRGRWLAAANPAWSWASDDGPAPPSADRWTTGTRAERVAWLRALRSTDPGAARDLLASTWASESATDRAAFLETFTVGHSHDDEAFLERALDDRAASVRSVAALLLDGLPESARAQRMADRARLLVRREGRVRAKLAVTLPDEPDAAARRDGVSDRREKGQGLRAAWLEQIVGATPLAVWEDHLGATPEEAVELARSEPGLRHAWALAAVAQGNGRWAAALLSAPGGPGDRLDPSLLAVLPPDEARHRLDAALVSRSVKDGDLLGAMGAVEGPWPPAMSQKAVERVRGMKADEVAIAIPVLARVCDPSVLPAVEDWITSAAGEGLRREVRRLAHALSIRLTIDREFQ